MRFAGRSAVVTGAGQGIGRAIAHALTAQGMRVLVSDLDGAAAARVAEEIGGHSLACDVRDPRQIADLVTHANRVLGQIDLWCSNAGFARGDGDMAVSADDAQWQDSWDVHVMAHVRACRLILPDMIARGEGWLLNVASAAGLLSQIGDAAYSATKHAAVSLAQSLAISHGDQGINVSVVCPLYVATPLLGYDDDRAEDRPHDRVILPDDVAQALVEGLRAGRFLILPHPEAADLARGRMADMDRWIEGMRKLRARVWDDENPDLRDLHRRI
ncbi:SDR family oxidoreductase [Aestuariicoccus sp. MJ-SS9]|uniref:SDR family NAD(P)-dependent oxidoreductase n=1 Tax=Aestuariicoccus sp. MJ-SS9 TaxID=3079855 RepID=UPI002911895F|nr:SDR family oxidoreductase [Aestuariicoccus sp. MJ-SS9]MDU8910889.1 SDR family oxidoreductase [Aestuariicoccus sp. MJ-SS9]